MYFDLAYFKPASGLNVAYQKKYQSNIFSVMQQLKYSVKNEKSLDMALFLNGIPIATLELKDRMTGSGYNVENAIRQYQTDCARASLSLNFAGVLCILCWMKTLFIWSRT